MSSLYGIGSKRYMIPVVKERKMKLCREIATIVQRCITEKQTGWNCMLKELDNYFESLSRVGIYCRVNRNSVKEDNASKECLETL